MRRVGIELEYAIRLSSRRVKRLINKFKGSGLKYLEEIDLDWEDSPERIMRHWVFKGERCIYPGDRNEEGDEVYLEVNTPATKQLSSLGKGLDILEAATKPGDFISSTGFHVHVEVPELIDGNGYVKTKPLLPIIRTLICLEPILFARWPGRERNLYCLPLDLELSNQYIQDCEKSLRRGKVVAPNMSDLYGGGISFTSLAQYGTIEFRMGQSVPSPRDILDWVSLCRDVISYSIDIGTEIGDCKGLEGSKCLSKRSRSLLSSILEEEE